MLRNNLNLSTFKSWKEAINPKVNKSEFILFSQILCGIRQFTRSGLELLQLRRGIVRYFLNSVVETKNMFSLVNKLGSMNFKIGKCDNDMQYTLKLNLQ